MIFAVDYRNAPENKCPKGINDSYDSMKHIYENAELYGIDSSKILLSGSSSTYNDLGAAAVIILP